MAAEGPDEDADQRDRIGTRAPPGPVGGSPPPGVVTRRPRWRTADVSGGGVGGDVEVVDELGSVGGDVGGGSVVVVVVEVVVVELAVVVVVVVVGGRWSSSWLSWWGRSWSSSVVVGGRRLGCRCRCRGDVVDVVEVEVVVCGGRGRRGACGWVWGGDGLANGVGDDTGFDVEDL